MFGHADATHWSKAYGQLSSVLTSQTPPDDDSDHLAIIKSLLLRDSAEEYRAWLLCALVPWARAPGVKPEQAGGKSPPSPATLATREGIKADNKIVKLVEDAVRDLQDIINHKDEGADATQSTDHTSPNVPRKRTYDVANLESRVKQGKAIRVWGPNWRSSVMYALLVQVTESEEKERPTAVKEFATWLQKLEAQELLEVDFLKPIVNGNQLSKALNEKPG